MIDKEDAIPHKRGTLYVRGLTYDTKAAFKAYCVRRGKSMCQIIEKFMQECARKERRAAALKLDKKKARRYNRKRLIKKKYGRVRVVEKRTGPE